MLIRKKAMSAKHRSNISRSPASRVHNSFLNRIVSCSSKAISRSHFLKKSACDWLRCPVFSA